MNRRPLTLLLPGLFGSLCLIYTLAPGRAFADKDSSHGDRKEVSRDDKDKDAGKNDHKEPAARPETPQPAPAPTHTEVKPEVKPEARHEARPERHDEPKPAPVAAEPCPERPERHEARPEQKESRHERPADHAEPAARPADNPRHNEQRANRPDARSERNDATNRPAENNNPAASVPEQPRSGRNDRSDQTEQSGADSGVLSSHPEVHSLRKGRDLGRPAGPKKYYGPDRRELPEQAGEIGTVDPKNGGTDKRSPGRNNIPQANANLDNPAPEARPEAVPAVPETMPGRPDRRHFDSPNGGGNPAGGNPTGGNNPAGGGNHGNDRRSGLQLASHPVRPVRPVTEITREHPAFDNDLGSARKVYTLEAGAARTQYTAGKDTLKRQLAGGGPRDLVKGDRSRPDGRAGQPTPNNSFNRNDRGGDLHWGDNHRNDDRWGNGRRGDWHGDDHRNEWHGDRDRGYGWGNDDRHHYHFRPLSPFIQFVEINRYYTPYTHVNIDVDVYHADHPFGGHYYYYGNHWHVYPISYYGRCRARNFFFFVNLGDYEERCVPEYVRDYQTTYYDETAPVSCFDSTDWVSLAYSRFALRDYPRAITAFSAAIDDNPDDGLLYFARAQAYIARGDYPAAYDDLIYGMELIPDWPNVQFNMVELYSNPGEFQRQFNKLEQWVDDHPRNNEAHFVLGYVYYFVQEYALARNELSYVLAYEPRHPQALDLLDAAYRHDD